MNTKKDYIRMVRWYNLIDSFMSYYFIRMIVVYLLSQGLVSWAIASIPIVLSFSTMISRCFKKVIEFSVKVDIKKYYLFFLVFYLLCAIIISFLKNYYVIYIIIFVMGFFKGIKNSAFTKICTQNSEYESACLIEEERSSVLGGTFGLIVSQFIYDISPKAYVVGFAVLLFINLFLISRLPVVQDNDCMEGINENKEIKLSNYKNIAIMVGLYSVFVGVWCVACGAFEVMAPLISDKIGYLEAIYTILEATLLFVISGNFLKKIKDGKNLIWTNTFVASFDILSLLVVSIALNWKGLVFGYVLSAFVSTIGDPLWASIMSAYSDNDRNKWVVVNKVYFLGRTIMEGVTLLVCHFFVIKGLYSFKYLAFILLGLLVILYFVITKLNKKLLNKSI